MESLSLLQSLLLLARALYGQGSSGHAGCNTYLSDEVCSWTGTVVFDCLRESWSSALYDKKNECLNEYRDMAKEELSDEAVEKLEIPGVQLCHGDQECVERLRENKRSGICSNVKSELFTWAILSQYKCEPCQKNKGT